MVYTCGTKLWKTIILFPAEKYQREGLESAHAHVVIARSLLLPVDQWPNFLCKDENKSSAAAVKLWIGQSYLLARLTISDWFKSLKYKWKNKNLRVDITPFSRIRTQNTTWPYSIVLTIAYVHNNFTFWQVAKLQGFNFANGGRQFVNRTDDIAVRVRCLLAASSSHRNGIVALGCRLRTSKPAGEILQCSILTMTGDHVRAMHNVEARCW